MGFQHLKKNIASYILSSVILLYFSVFFSVFLFYVSPESFFTKDTANIHEKKKNIVHHILDVHSQHPYE